MGWQLPNRHSSKSHQLVVVRSRTPYPGHVCPVGSISCFLVEMP
jgi:hypothetical protein